MGLPWIERHLCRLRGKGRQGASIEGEGLRSQGHEEL